MQKLETCPSLLISTQSMTFLNIDFYTTKYFVSQMNCKTLAVERHALTRTRYFYILTAVISHPAVYKEGLNYLSLRAVFSLSSSSSHECICKGLELFCVHFSLLYKMTG
jgi:hypothetical protein